MSRESFDRECWARTVWMEARGEGYEGMRAVAWVIANRVASGRWRYRGLTSIALVCLADQQFSCWNAARADDNREAMAVASEESLETAYQIVDAINARTDSDPTGGATHYYATSMATPPAWAATGRLTLTQGNHRFYAGVP